MKIRYRPACGGLDQAIALSKTFKSKEEMYKHIFEMNSGYLVPGIHTLTVEKYSEEPDRRIGWKKTCIVMMHDGNKSSYPIGYCDTL